MPQYTKADDGKVVDGRIIVWIEGRTGGDGDAAGLGKAAAGAPGSAGAARRESQRKAAARRQETAVAAAATLQAASAGGVPFCEECDKLRRKRAAEAR